MSELIQAVTSWRLLLAVLLIFGLAPGLLLRIIVLAFHRDDPRRRELRGELINVPRWERPVWVFEQLEVALVEGLGERIEWAMTGRMIHRWHLRSGVSSNRAHPETFWIPDDREKQAITPGAHVKLMFMMRDGWGERMWVHVHKVGRRRLVGCLNNQPIGIPRLDYGQKIRFTRDDVIDITFAGHDEAMIIEAAPLGDRPAIACCAGCNGPNSAIDGE